VLGFSLDDVIGMALVYAYIAIVFTIAEKLWKGDPAVGRKILHISIGNIVFILLLFNHWWAEVIIAGSALFFSLLITRRMQQFFLRLTKPDKENGHFFKNAFCCAINWLSGVSSSGAGNEFGLVYYCLMFTLLAFLFFRTPLVIAVGILPLAYGDGLGALLGQKYGRHLYRVIDKKSVEGTLAVFLGTVLALLVGMAFYGLPLPDALWKASLIGLAVAVVEGLAPWGLDNVAIPVVSVAIFLLLEAV
jgi:phytol kinase